MEEGEEEEFSRNFLFVYLFFRRGRTIGSEFNHFPSIDTDRFRCEGLERGRKELLARSVRAHTKPPRFELQSAHPAASRPAGSRLVNYPPFLCNFMLNFRHPFSHGTAPPSRTTFSPVARFSKGAEPLFHPSPRHLSYRSSLFVRGDLLFLSFCTPFFLPLPLALLLLWQCIFVRYYSLIFCRNAVIIIITLLVHYFNARNK